MIRETSAGDASELVWFKSSYSGGTNGESCIEIAMAPGTTDAAAAAVHVRDSKDVSRPSLTLTSGAWARFVSYASAH